MVKIYRRALWIVLMAVAVALLIVLPTAAKDPDPAAKKPAPRQSTPKKATSKEPVHITSDTLEAFNDERLVVFSGNAVAVQGDKVIRADKLLVYYKKAADEGKEASTANVGQGGDLDRIEAKGPVRITQQKKIVTGDEGVFYQDDQKIVVFGNAVMREGANIVKGDRITVLLDENRGIVEATDKKRVTATIYPAEEGKQKK